MSEPHEGIAERQRETGRNRQTDRDRERETGRQKERERETETDRQRERETDRERERERETDRQLGRERERQTETEKVYADRFCRRGLPKACFILGSLFKDFVVNRKTKHKLLPSSKRIANRFTFTLNGV